MVNLLVRITWFPDNQAIPNLKTNFKQRMMKISTQLKSTIMKTSLMLLWLEIANFSAFGISKIKISQIKNVTSISHGFYILIIGNLNWHIWILIKIINFIFSHFFIWFCLFFTNNLSNKQSKVSQTQRSWEWISH